MQVPKDWWKDFFSGLAVDLWRAVTNELPTPAEADFIERRLRLEPGAHVLDVPCGGGRLALELASRGYRLTGVEYSSTFIEQARAASEARRLSIAWEQRDMHELPWAAAFDGAFCFGNSFGYLEDGENRQFLDAVARALKPGAWLILETTCLEMVLKCFQERSWFEVGGILMLEENQYDLAQSRINTDYTFVADGRVERKLGSQRYYAFAELCRLLEEAGFKEVESFGSLEMGPPSIGSPHLFLTACRR